jgi:hypothetical protein
VLYSQLISPSPQPRCVLQPLRIFVLGVWFRTYILVVQLAGEGADACALFLIAASSCSSTPLAVKEGLSKPLPFLVMVGLTLKGWDMIVWSVGIKDDTLLLNWRQYVSDSLIVAIRMR